ncbi:hypothetical protein MWU75_09885 [Ornithinimicrobium sp. F0845]|uniref:hypothetical protein n=1 Tax=Ornithinimicrobium sp. F0845 TaxID=2926412 RepID=UPI001FF35473|nr:hypothetical protein [Ornithinimicrobium sp. F0845]MCK0112447.1 hypothetical protein [Ornithinimicrobium sp. F0845]
MGPVAVVAVWVVLLAGWTVLRGDVVRRAQTTGVSPLRLLRPRPWSIGLWCVVAVPSLVQVAAAPELLKWGQRESSALAAGQWWRLVTALGLQDGGWAGTAFNLAVLAVTLLLVGAVWRGVPAVLVFLVGGVLANALTWLVLDQTGAGNSMATLCLLAVVAVATAWPGSGWWSWSAVLPVLLMAAAAVTLLAVRDQHGLAVALGLLGGAVLRWSGPRWSRPWAAQDASVVPS